MFKEGVLHFEGTIWRFGKEKVGFASGNDENYVRGITRMREEKLEIENKRRVIRVFEGIPKIETKESLPLQEPLPLFNDYGVTAQESD